MIKDEKQRVLAASFTFLDGQTDKVLVTDYDNHRIRQVDLDGNVRTVREKFMIESKNVGEVNPSNE